MAFVLDLSQGSADHNGKLETYAVDAAHATLLAPGDVVVITGESDTLGVAEVDAAAPGAAVTGVVAGFELQYAGENLTETGLPASTAGKARVHIDPNLNFIADVVNGPLVAADVGLNIDIAATAATKSGGLTISNMSVDAATKLSTATLQFRIVGLVPDGVDGTPTGLKARVRLNNTTTRGGVAGV
jgi:hypothetical protein